MNTMLIRYSVPVIAVAVAAVFCPEGSCEKPQFQALKCPRTDQGSTWKILERDGANRKVESYLSSLGQGETGAGVISSPPFKIATKSIEFAICGHDGPDGDAGKNHVALVDTRKGRELRRAGAPGNDAMLERVWDVRELQGQEVRLELHDGHRGSAFAWMGIGFFDAGEAMDVDFSQGMPSGWKRSRKPSARRYELITDGVPFRRDASVYNLIPNSGELVIPCGFRAERLFLLGCTVGLGRPLEVHGGIELHYESGQIDLIPLMVGFTLEGRGKQLSGAPSVHLHRSGNPFQYYVPLALRDEPLQKIRLVTDPQRGSVPRVTAVTVQTGTENDRLTGVPVTKMSPEEKSWIENHLVSADTMVRKNIREKIRAAYQVPEPPATKVRFQKTVVDPEFRGEGVAVADFNQDGHLDIAVGYHLYLGPDWTLKPLLDEPRTYPVKGYSDAFLCFDDDVDKDGWRDLVVVGFPGRATHWSRNPGESDASWERYLAVEKTGNWTLSHPTRKAYFCSSSCSRGLRKSKGNVVLGGEVADLVRTRTLEPDKKPRDGQECPSYNEVFCPVLRIG